MNMWRARDDNRLSFNDLSTSVLSVPVKNLYKSVNIFYNRHLCRAARNNKEQTPNIPVMIRGGQRSWRRPVVTHDLVNGRCRRSRRDERQRRSPPGPLPAAINHRRPAVCTNSVRGKTFKRYKTHRTSDLVPPKTFSRYQIPIMTRITYSARW